MPNDPTYFFGDVSENKEHFLRLIYHLDVNQIMF